MRSTLDKEVSNESQNAVQGDLRPLLDVKFMGDNHGSRSNSSVRGAVPRLIEGVPVKSSGGKFLVRIEVGHVRHDAIDALIL